MKAKRLLHDQRNLIVFVMLNQLNTRQVFSRNSLENFRYSSSQTKWKIENFQEVVNKRDLERGNKQGKQTTELSLKIIIDTKVSIELRNNELKDELSDSPDSDGQDTWIGQGRRESLLNGQTPENTPIVQTAGGYGIKFATLRSFELRGVEEQRDIVA